MENRKSTVFCSFKRLLFLIAVALLLITSCQKDSDTETLLTYSEDLEYFPVDSGFTRFYTVDSIFWDDFTGNHDTVSYELKEVLSGVYFDNQGRKGQRIERFKKDEAGNWIIYKVRASLRTNTTAEVTEENIRYIKLTFPVELNERWNGNSYNDFGNLTYQYETAGSDQFGGFNFQETVKVLQDDDPPNLLEDRYGEEHYAKGIGLYYRKNLSLKFVFPDPTPFNGPDTASGFIYTEKLTAVLPPQ